jgi:hypothetical protein
MLTRSLFSCAAEQNGGPYGLAVVEGAPVGHRGRKIIAYFEAVQDIVNRTNGLTFMGKTTCIPIPILRALM